ncbi:hypothetical protein GCM10023205_70820 [Yinghuangia aomiensis]|uniref:Uncharacterized protein n=1 Tax=Yinghuangia aomiensis TaxID=676205 RepID=A0ABP9I753_9ACTN
MPGMLAVTTDTPKAPRCASGAEGRGTAALRHPGRTPPAAWKLRKRTVVLQTTGARHTASAYDRRIGTIDCLWWKRFCGSQMVLVRCRRG